MIPRRTEQYTGCTGGLTGATTPIAGNQPNWWCVTEDGAEGARALNNPIVDDGGGWRTLFAHPDEDELIEAHVAVVWY